MADTSARMMNLDPSSSPFVPNQHNQSNDLVMAPGRHTLSASPEHDQGQQLTPRSSPASSIADLRAKSSGSGSDVAGNEHNIHGLNPSPMDHPSFSSRLASSPGIPSAAFQDYSIAAGRRRAPFAANHGDDDLSARSEASGGGFIAQFPVGGGAQRMRDNDDRTFNPLDSSPVDILRDPVNPIGVNRDFRFSNALPNSAPSPFQQLGNPSPSQSPFGAPGPVSFARPPSVLRSGETEKTYSSAGDGSSVDFPFDRDQSTSFSSSSLGALGDENGLSGNQGFPLSLQGRASLSTRSMSTNYDVFHSQANTTRGTTPLSQSFEETSGSSSGFYKSSLAPPSNDRITVSRTSSRSFSNASNSQTFERPTFEQQTSALNFETQAKASPFINDLLDRLLRCEYSAKEIQRELSDVSRKVNFLVERALADSSNPDHNNNVNDLSFPPHRGSVSGGPGMNNGPLNRSGNGPMNGPNGGSDDVRLLSQRLNSLTTSVSQLLTLQTQAHMNNVNNNGSSPHLNSNHPNNNGHHNHNHGPNGPIGLGINGPSGPTGPMGGNGPLGPHQTHMLPSRPEHGLGMGPPPHRGGGGIRNAGPNGPGGPGGPQRQWSSSGNMGGGGGMNMPEIQRSASDAGLMMGSMGNPMLRDKRKMSVGGLLRRDSTSTIDGENNSRDGGPVITKWESLPLLPDLLRSIAKYGVGPPNKIQQRSLPFLLRGQDIIAQAPPTQERIAAYVIPAIHIALLHMNGKPTPRGPIAVIISTTVDQATQAQRMIRDLGGPIGVRSSLGVGTGGDIVQELRLLQQSMPHILCGTPQKLHALFTSPGGLPGHDVRFLVLDEVDQLIARNLHDFVFNIVKLFPAPRSRPLTTPAIGGSAMTTPVGTPSANSGPANLSPFELSLVNINNGGTGSLNERRFSTSLPNNDVDSPLMGGGLTGSQTPGQQQPSGPPERQTALFSNTVPQDVLNLANAIQLREPIRVLVRRDGNVTHADTSNGARGLRQFYLYLAFAPGARSDMNGQAANSGGLGIIGSGRGATSAETNQAREWKLDALADLFDDIEVLQAIVHVGGLTSLESVVYKLASRGLEAVPLHGDMNAGTKLAALNKFRGTSNPIGRPPVTKVLVVYDVQVKAPDVFQVPLVINYDLPKAVEEYAHRVAPAISSSYSRAGVVINFVTATGGDVEMLRSIECFYKIKCPEVPMSLRDVI